MAYEISVTHQDVYMFVHIQGDPLTLEERRSAVAKMLAEAAESNLDIVAHEDTHGWQPLAASEYFGRANFLATSDFRKRIAYVPPPEMPSDTHELIANAAKNEGHQVRVFPRVKDAIKWIECPGEDTD
jgi:hypothetical protein